MSKSIAAAAFMSLMLCSAASANTISSASSAGGLNAPAASEAIQVTGSNRGGGRGGHGLSAGGGGGHAMYATGRRGHAARAGGYRRARGGGVYGYGGGGYGYDGGVYLDDGEYDGAWVYESLYVDWPAPDLPIADEGDFLGGHGVAHRQARLRDRRDQGPAQSRPNLRNTERPGARCAHEGMAREGASKLDRYQGPYLEGLRGG